MNGRYLLDTNAIIALFANEPQVEENLAHADEVFLPIIAIGELCYGARKSEQTAHNLQRIDEFAASNVVLGCDTNTARHYGEVKNNLRLKGRPIPENDIWIAALAIQYDLTLVTNDEHFQGIENLKAARW